MGQLLTCERLILQACVREGKDFPTDVQVLRNARYPNPVGQRNLGEYRSLDSRKCVTADLEVINALAEAGRNIPGFLEAGPREEIAFTYPCGDAGLTAAVVTAGGLAPGLNSVVHSIVDRHLRTYRMLIGSGGVWGFLDSFKGMIGDKPRWVQLDVETTERWLDVGGSELGSIRFKDRELCLLAEKIAENLARWEVDILYVIGGDGSLTTAHEIARLAERTIVAGIPKTMDNDILWVWQSFGFNTAVERATSFINTIHSEAESTRRISVVEFFGAQAGFVAANAALASGHVDLAMIPEVFDGMQRVDAEKALIRYVDHINRTIKRKGDKPHAVIVIAEGTGEALAELGASLHGRRIGKSTFPGQFAEGLKPVNMAKESVASFTLRPRYYIRAVPANPHDQIYCKRLGALAVDNALAGFTDFMISQWLTEYVLVPLDLVAGGQKRVPPGGMFWKQVVEATRQPAI
jgi:6-phosphofructokinase 1